MARPLRTGRGAKLISSHVAGVSGSCNPSNHQAPSAAHHPAPRRLRLPSHLAIRSPLGFAPMSISKFLDRARPHRQPQQQPSTAMMNRPFVLVPLYIYPSESAWEPLLDAARRYRDVLFVAVINPNSGPGEGHLPDGSYTAALARLAGEPAYRGWWHRGGLRVGGVFFDETPSDAAAVPYMTRLAAYAKETWRRDVGTPGGCPMDTLPSSSAASSPSSPPSSSPSPSPSTPPEAVVVYNPGVVVCPDMFRGADYVVVFEASEDQWNRLRRLGQDLRRIDARVRGKAVAIIHSSRGGQDSRAARKVIEQSRSLGMTGVYVTDQQDGGYTRWPASWMKFAEAVSQC
ncbi:hypothetical protein HIM_00511 [Hirsutella minnesotensis 3608]|nr:hypothetical protein HIM_00511 [Hirsutella minnesotensis 3608]